MYLRGRDDGPTTWQGELRSALGFLVCDQFYLECYILASDL